MKTIPCKKFKVALIVAHPDDETLWAGGTILMHADWDWFIMSLCRGSDTDRAPHFCQAVKQLQAKGQMGDLDDSPQQKPLDNAKVQKAILSLLPTTTYDLVITHAPKGEYTRHLRHEETCKAVVTLWKSGKISTRALWMFAYEDGGGKYLPAAIEGADLVAPLPQEIWECKYNLLTNIYGFHQQSLEAKTTPKTEAFWCFESPQSSFDFINQTGEQT